MPRGGGPMNHKMTDAGGLLEASLSQAAAGDLTDALDLALRAVALEPHSALAEARTGALLAAMHRPEEALIHLARAIELDPGAAEPTNNLGVVMRLLGRGADAENCFARAVFLAPYYADAIRNMLSPLLNESRFAEAAQKVHALIDAGLDSAPLRIALGRAYWGLGKLELGVEAFQAAATIAPDDATAWSYLGLTLAELGDLENAKEAHRRAIGLAPNAPRFYRYLADVDAGALTETHQRQIESALAGGTLLTDDRIEADLVLAMIAERKGRVEDAFRHYVSAAQGERAFRAYDEAATLSALTRVRDLFPAHVINDRINAYDSDAPVFIFGMPRSGTTLVEQLLASHPAVFAAGELELFETILDESIAQAGKLTAIVGKRYDDALRALAPSMVSRITDKMPANFRFAGLIHLVLPRATMIHVRRDALDTAWSCFTTRFVPHAQPWSYDFEELARYYKAYESLMSHWRSALPPGRILEVQYEELVNDFEGVARRIVSHCGLAWDDRVLRFFEAKRPVRTASAAQVRRPIYRSSIGRARAYGDLIRPLADALRVAAHD